MAGVVLSKGGATSLVAGGIKSSMRAVPSGVALTLVLIKRGPTDSMCIGDGVGTYSTIKVYIHSFFLSSGTARGSLLSVVSDYGGSDGIRNVLMRVPLPSRVSSGVMVGTVSPSGSISKLAVVGRKGLVTNLSAVTPTAPGKMVALLGGRCVSVIKGGIMMVNEDVLMNGPLTLLFLGGGTAIAVTRSEAAGLGSLAGETSVLTITINGPGFVATSVMGGSTMMMSVKVGEMSKGLVNSMGFGSMSSVTSCVSPIPGNIKPVAVTSLLSGVLSYCRVRGEGESWVGNVRGGVVSFSCYSEGGLGVGLVIKLNGPKGGCSGAERGVNFVFASSLIGGGGFGFALSGGLRAGVTSKVVGGSGICVVRPRACVGLDKSTMETMYGCCKVSIGSVLMVCSSLSLPINGMEVEPGNSDNNREKVRGVVSVLRAGSVREVHVNVSKYSGSGIVSCILKEFGGSSSVSVSLVVSGTSLVVSDCLGSSFSGFVGECGG